MENAKIRWHVFLTIFIISFCVGALASMLPTEIAGSSEKINVLKTEKRNADADKEKLEITHLRIIEKPLSQRF